MSIISRSSIQLRLLQVAICLCICASCMGAIYQCKGKHWWWLTDQRVKVRNPSFGRTRVAVNFDEVFWSGSWDMVRRKELTDSHVTIKSGWRNIFTNTNKYKAIENSAFELKKSESGDFKSNKRTVTGNLKLGFNVIEEGDVRYEYRASQGGVCKAG